jgi:hypothetical protein
LTTRPWRLAAALATLRMKVATTLVRRLVVLERALDGGDDAHPLPDGLRLAILDRHADWAAYRALRPAQDPALLVERTARGDLCFVVLDGERAVHATWGSCTTGPLPYLDADAVLEPGDVVLYDAFTATAWRGRSISRSRDELCRRHYRAAGLRRSLAFVALENEAGLRTTVPLGYVRLGTYGLLRLGPLRHRWRESSGLGPMPRLLPRS